MPKSVVEVKCLNSFCGHWFNSPIFFGDGVSFDTSTLLGNIVQCPRCNTMTPCNKENMRIDFGDGGGFRGIDTL